MICFYKFHFFYEKSKSQKTLNFGCVCFQVLDKKRFKNVFIVNEAEDDGMDFESTTGTSLQTLVDQMKDKDLTELASELRSEQPSKEVSQHDKLEKEEEEAATIYKNRKSSLSENDDAQNTVKTKTN